MQINKGDPKPSRFDIPKETYAKKKPKQAQKRGRFDDLSEALKEDKADEYFKAQKRLARIEAQRAAKARLDQKTILQRAKAMYAVAHPKFIGAKDYIAPRLQSASSNVSSLVVAKIPVGRFIKAKSGARALSGRRVKLVAGVVAVLLLSALIVRPFGTQQDTSGAVAVNDEEASETDVKGAQDAAVEVPFDVLDPNGDDRQSTAKFDPEKKTASIGINIDGIPATLSQQQVPGEQLGQDTFLLSVAQSFGLNKKIESEKGEVFIGSNAQQAVTTIVFVYEDFLVFVRTDGAVIEDQSAIDFINNLQ